MSHVVLLLCLEVEQLEINCDAYLECLAIYL